MFLTIKDTALKSLLSRGRIIGALVFGVVFAAMPAFATPSWDTAIPWTTVATTISGLVLAAVAAGAALFGGFQGLKAAMSAFVQVVSKSFGR